MSLVPCPNNSSTSRVPRIVTWTVTPNIVLNTDAGAAVICEAIPYFSFCEGFRAVKSRHLSSEAHPPSRRFLKGWGVKRARTWDARRPNIFHWPRTKTIVETSRQPPPCLRASERPLVFRRRAPPEPAALRSGWTPPAEPWTNMRPPSPFRLPRTLPSPVVRGPTLIATLAAFSGCPSQSGRFNFLSPFRYLQRQSKRVLGDHELDQSRGGGQNGFGPSLRVPRERPPVLKTTRRGA